MNRNELIMWIAARGCVRTVDAARRLGIRVGTAQMRLRRLRRRGVLRVVWAGGTAWWCVPGAEPPTAPRVVPRRREGTSEVMQKIDQLVGGGCAATAALMKALGLSHTQAFYALRLLQAEGRAVEVALGRVALWCRDRDAAQKFIETLKAEVLRLVSQHGLRYVTPKRLFELVARDAKAREVFSHIISVKPPPSASAYSVLKALLGAAYGAPISKSIYYTAQPSNSINIDIRETVGERVSVALTPDLAETLAATQDADSLVLQAIEQLLQRYKT
jgi:hypothetical protein